jgi:Holliday junction resolvase RusA-like endonuclease
MIRKVINWKPRAKQRPRTVVQGGKTLTFTPKETRDAEAAIAEQWDHPPFEGPILVDLILSDTKIEIQIVKTIEPESKKLRGDIDNYAKTILDALNGVAWDDDSQICELRVLKQ